MSQGFSSLQAAPAFQQGNVVQTGYTQDGVINSGAVVTPTDYTIPQVTEGNEFMSLSFTPTSASNLLRIDVVAILSPSTAQWINSHLLVDGAADAVASTTLYHPVGTGALAHTITHWMTAGTVSAMTFAFRADVYSSGTVTFNLYGGGSSTSSMTVTEYLP